jgi:hypothetical protein
MNRRMFFPSLFALLVLSAAIIAFPVQSAPSQQATSTPQATSDPCNPTFTVQGVFLRDEYIFDQPSIDTGIRLILVRETNRVEVLGQNENGFWVLVRTNWGIVGWARSPYVAVDPVQFNDPTVVPVVEGIPTSTAEATTEATPEASAEAVDPFADCPGFEAIIVADAFQLQAQPRTDADSIGVTVRRNDRVTVIASNPTESWLLVRTSDGSEGWILSAYAEHESGLIDRVRRDYTFYEATLTPRP